jgi:hypothetical protein
MGAKRLIAWAGRIGIGKSDDGELDPSLREEKNGALRGPLIKDVGIGLFAQEKRSFV